jgi:acetyl esterase/lipase
MLTALTSLFRAAGSGRSPAVLLNLLAPRRGYRLHRALAYGEGERHRFDLYVPDRLQTPAPVILFFYGGGFVAGHRSEYRMAGEALASLGAIVAIADYRIYPEVRFPEFLHDGGRAFLGVRAMVAGHGGDLSRMFLCGHSAGAYISVMLAVNPRYLEEAGADPAWVKGVIGIAGAYDFLPIQGERRIAVFGGGNRLETQPVHFVDGRKAPMLLASGSKDKTVYPRNTRNMAGRLRAVGSPVEERVYPNIGHIGIMLSLAKGFRGLAPLREDIREFVAQN